MALIKYPLPNANTFVDVAEATVIINDLTLDDAHWAALTVEEQESLLRITYRIITDGTDPATYPDPLPTCVGEAQALMAIHGSVNDLYGGAVNTAVTGALRSQKVGSLEVSYYDTKDVTKTAAQVSVVPDLARKCLEMLGFSLPSDTKGLKQSRLGRS